MIWHSELSDNHQSLIDIRSEDYDSWINYVVARSTSGGDYPAVCLPCYLVFECRIHNAMIAIMNAAWASYIFCRAYTKMISESGR